MKEVFSDIKGQFLKELVALSEACHDGESDEEPEGQQSANRESITEKPPHKKMAPKKGRSSSSKIESLSIVQLKLDKQGINGFIDEYKKYGAKGTSQALTVLFYLYSKKQI